MTKEQIADWFNFVDEWIDYALEHKADRNGAFCMREKLEHIKALALSAVEQGHSSPAGQDVGHLACESTDGVPNAEARARIWFDTEFIEDGRTIELLSIGLVREDGERYYAEVAETDRSRASPWVKENVLPFLKGPVLHRETIARCLVQFVGEKPEFWAYYADYDWVALCQLFGTMMDLPKGWPMYCRDLKQWADQLGNPRLPEQGKGEHHALADALWNRSAWKFLDALAAVTGKAPDVSPPNEHKP